MTAADSVAQLCAFAYGVAALVAERDSRPAWLTSYLGLLVYAVDRVLREIRVCAQLDLEWSSESRAVRAMDLVAAAIHWEAGWQSAACPICDLQRALR